MRASKAASKIGSLKRGSQALSTASGCTRSISSHERGPVGGVDALGREAIGLARAPAAAAARARAPRRRATTSLEHRAALGDRRERRAHTAGTDHENPHAGQSDAKRRRARTAGPRVPDSPQCRGSLTYAAPIRAAPDSIRP